MRNVPSGEEQGETDAFAGYLCAISLFFFSNTASYHIELQSASVRLRAVSLFLQIY